MKKQIKKYYLFIGLFLAPLFLLAQNTEIDSLRKIVNQLPADTNKVKMLNEISWDLIYISEYDEATAYAKQALSLSNQLNYLIGKVKAIVRMGLIKQSQGKFPAALEQYFQALHLSNDHNFTYGKNMALNNIGNTYYLLKDYTQALDYHLMALKTAEDLNDVVLIAKSYNNIGNVYKALKSYSKALDYYLKSYNIRKHDLKKEDLAAILSNIGQVYAHTNELDKALDYNRQALEIRKTNGNLEGVANSLNNIGFIYYEQKHYPEAIVYYNEELELAKKIGNQYYESMALINRAMANFALKNYTDAISDAESSMKLSREFGMIEDVIEDYRMLAEYYYAAHQIERSADAYQKHLHLKDSLLNIEQSRALVEKMQQYEFDREREKKEIEAEKEKVVANEKIKRQKIVIQFFAVVVLLLLLLGFVIYKAFQQKKNDNHLLTIKNKEIEEKHREITNSINYAKRIQNAILPPLSTIQKVFPESFVLFKPKDIVSGDFYWFKESKDGYLVAAADCTGHGVPGAFMNMIGYERLNEASQQSSNPSEILNSLNRGIKTSLRQTNYDDSTRDGMDIALCYIDNSLTKLMYAGAHRPLWVLKKTDTVVTEIKATKVSIGGYTEDEQLFEKHEIALERGDTFYIFSDGYVDQFGGAVGKKLTSKRLKEILIEIKQKPMLDQKKYLEDFLLDWKANNDQIDDILIIGIRIPA